MANDLDGPSNKQVSYYAELTDEEKLKRYRNRVQWSEKKQDRWRKQALVWLTYYRNRPTVFTKGGQKVIVPTIIKNVDAMFAALTAFQVVPVVAPKGLTTYDMAEVQQQALRNEWDEQEVPPTAEHAIKEGVITGIGYVKVGYEYEEDESITQTTGDTPEGEATATETETVVVKDRVVVDHIPYDELYFDPEAKKWDDITWLCQKYELPLETVKADPSFENTSDLGASGYINDMWRVEMTRSGDNENTDEQRVTLFEFWDLERGTVCTFAEGHERVLKEAPNPFATRLDMRKRNPFVPFIPRTDVGEVIGISDILVMKPAVDEQNVLRSSIATYVERMKPKLLADEGVFSEQGKKALRSQEWGEVVELRQGAVLSNSVRPMDMPSLPQEAFIQDSKAAADASDSIGMNEMLAGQLPVGRKTATAMQQLGQATTVRQSEKRNHLERFYREIADKMLFLMQSFYEQDRITRMVEDMGDVVWEWNNEDISFEVAVAAEVEPKEILDTEAKREKFMALLNILGADPAINQQALKKYVLKEGLGIPAEIVRTLLKSEEEVQAEAQQGQQHELALRGMGGGMEGAPMGGEMPSDQGLLAQAQSGEAATAAPIL